MFAFAVCGNGTYVAVRRLLPPPRPTSLSRLTCPSRSRAQSILLTSTSPQHILVNAPWLLGSGGTIFLDLIVLGQFLAYAKERRLEAAQQGVFARDDESVLADDVADEA